MVREEVVSDSPVPSLLQLYPEGCRGPYQATQVKVTYSLVSAVTKTSSKLTLNSNETWSGKDKQILDVKTTRSNLGKLITYNISILHSIRFIESDWLRAVMQFQDRAVGFMWGEGSEKVDLIQIQDIWPRVM